MAFSAPLTSMIGSYHHTHISSSNPITSTTLLFKPPVEHQPYTGTPGFQTWTISSSQLNLVNFSKGLEGPLQPINPVLHGSNGNVLLPLSAIATHLYAIRSPSPYPHFFSQSPPNSTNPRPPPLPSHLSTENILHTDSHVILTDDIGNVYSIPRNLIDLPTIPILPLTLLYSNRFSLPVIDLKVLSYNLIALLSHDEFVVLDLTHLVYNSPLYTHHFSNHITAKIPHFDLDHNETIKNAFQSDSSHNFTPIALNFGEHRSLYSAYTYKAHIHLNRHKMPPNQIKSVTSPSKSLSPTSIFSHFANPPEPTPVCYIVCEEGVVTTIFPDNAPPITTSFLFSSFTPTDPTIPFLPLTSKPVAILDVLCESPQPFSTFQHPAQKNQTSQPLNTTPSKTPSKLQPQFTLQPKQAGASSNTGTAVNSTLAKLQSRSRLAGTTSAPPPSSTAASQLPLTHRQLIVLENAQMAIFYTYTNQGKQISTLIPLSLTHIFQPQSQSKIALSDVFTVQFNEEQQYISAFNKISNQQILFTLTIAHQDAAFTVNIASTYNFNELVKFVKIPIFFQTALHSIKTNVVADNVINHDSFTYIVVSQNNEAVDVLNLPHPPQNRLQQTPSSPSHSSPTTPSTSTPPPAINISLQSPDNSRAFQWDPEVAAKSIPHSHNFHAFFTSDLDSSFVTVIGGHTPNRNRKTMYHDPARTPEKNSTAPHDPESTPFNLSSTSLPSTDDHNQHFQTPAPKSTSFIAQPSLMKSSLTNHQLPQSALRPPPSTAKRFRFVDKATATSTQHTQGSTGAFGQPMDNFVTPAKAFHPKLQRTAPVGHSVDNSNDLKQRIQELEAEKQHLDQQRNVLQSHVSSLQEIIKSQKDEIAELTAQFAQINGRSDDEKLQKIQLEAAKTALEAQVNTLSAQLDQLQAQSADLDRLSAELNEMQAENEKLKNALEIAQNDKNQSSNDLTAVQNEIDQLRQDALDKVNENGSSVNVLQTLLREVRDELVQSNNGLQSKQDQLAHLDAKYNDMIAAFAKLQGDNALIQEELDKCTSDLKQLAEDKTTLQTQHSDLQMQHQGLQHHHGDALGRIRELQEELAHFSQSQPDLADMVARSLFDEKIKQLGQELFNEKEVAKRWENEFGEQSQLLKTLTIQKQAEYDNLLEKYNEQTEQSQEMAEKLQEMEALEADYDELARKHNGLLKEKNAIKSTCDELVEKYNNQTQQTKQIVEKLQEMETSQSELETDYDELARKHNGILKEKNAIQATCDELTKDLNKLNQRLKDYQDKLQNDHDVTKDNPADGSLSNLLSLQQQSYNTLLEQYEQVMKQLEQSGNEHQRTVVELESTCSKLSEFKTIIQLAQDREETLLNEYIKLQTDFNALLTNQKGHETKLLLTESERDELRLQTTELSDQVRTLVGQTETLQQSFDEQSHELSEKDSRLSSALSEIQTKDIELEFLRNKFAVLQEEHDKLRGQSTDDVSDRQGELIVLREQCNQLTTDRDTLEKAVQEKDNELQAIAQQVKNLAALEQQVNDNLAQCNEASAQLLRQRDEIDQLTKDKQQLQKDLSEKTKESEDFMTKLASAMTELAKLRQDSAANADSGATLQHENAELQELHAQIVDTLYEKIKQQEADLKDKAIQLHQTHQHHVIATEELEKLLNDYEQLGADLQNMNTIAQNADVVNQSLSSDLSNTKSELSELKSQRDQLSKDKDDLKSQLRDLEAQNKALEATNMGNDQKSAQDRDIVDTLHAQLANKETAIAKLQSEYDEAKSALGTAQVESNSLRDDITAKNGEISANDAKIDTLSQRIAELEAELSTKTDEIQARDEQIAAKETELAAKDDEITKKDKTIIEKDSELRSKDEVLSNQVQKISTQDEVTKQLEADKTALEAENADLVAKLAKAETDIDTAKQQVDSNSTSNDKLLTEVEQLKKDIENNESKLDGLQKQLDSRDNELKAKDELVKEQQSSLADKEDQLVAKDTELSAKQDELDTLQKANEELSIKLQQVGDTSNESYDKLSEQDALIAELKAKIDESTAKADKAEKDAEQLHTDLATARNDTQTARDEAQVAQDKAKQAQDVGDEARIKLSDAEKQLTDANSQLDNLQAQTAKLQKARNLYKEKLYKAQGTIEELQLELSSTQEIFSDCEQKLVNLEAISSQNAQLQLQVTDLKTQLDKSATTIKTTNDLVVKLATRAKLSVHELDEIYSQL